MSVEIEPFELTFHRPFTVEVSQTLMIKNPNTVPVAFKVKTTAPKQYCVRPNAGRIEPGQGFDVSVLLQAMKVEPPIDAKCRDKFLVQSAPITADKEFASIVSVLENTSKDLIQDRKIRVNWVTGAEATQAADAIRTPSKQTTANTNIDTPEVSRTYSSPHGNADSAPPPYDDSKTSIDDDGSEVPVKSAVSQATAAVTSTAQLAYEELKNKLAAAEAQVANLSDSGVRQRKVQAAEKKVTETVQAVKQGAEGVPVQIVALLCILSFLLAYFFF